MEFLDFTWNYIIMFLLVLGVLVFVHEWGHYWVAKKAGVRIEVFSIGFGPEVFGWNDSTGTRWKVGALPLGGYVKMFGEAVSEIEEGSNSNEPVMRELTEDEKKVSFNHKTLGQRTAIVFAGPLANFIFAAVAVALLSLFVGTPRALPTVGEVSPGSAAEVAGLQKGDVIVSVNDVEVAWFDELREVIAANPGIEMPLVVTRGSETLPFSIVPKVHTAEDGSTIGLLGVRADDQAVEHSRLGPIDAAWSGVVYTGTTIWQIFVVLGEMISGDRSADDLGGPLRIAQISGDVAQVGVPQLIMFMAALSVNLGLINLFPIPVLDGGRLVFYAAEAVRGRPLGEKAEEYSLRFGLGLILILVVFVTWNDIKHLLSI